jgi:hypothetical protein
MQSITRFPLFDNNYYMKFSHCVALFQRHSFRLSIKLERATAKMTGSGKGEKMQVVVVGPGGVGKSAITLSFVRNMYAQYNTNAQPSRFCSDA